MKINVQQMLSRANSVIDTISVQDAVQLHGDTNVAFVDLREGSEQASEGVIPNSVHTPRGFLEFYADPGMPMHKDTFSSGKKLILFCASGGRSTLATKTLLDMGLTNVVNLVGGFAAWREAGGPVEKI